MSLFEIIMAFGLPLLLAVWYFGFIDEKLRKKTRISVMPKMA